MRDEGDTWVSTQVEHREVAQLEHFGGYLLQVFVSQVKRSALLELSYQQVPLIVRPSRIGHVWHASCGTLLGFLSLNFIITQSHLEVLLQLDGVRGAHGWFDGLQRVALDVQPDQFFEHRDPRVNVSQLVVGDGKRLQSVHVQDGLGQVLQLVTVQVKHGQLWRVLEIRECGQLVVTQADRVELGRIRHRAELSEVVLMKVQHDQASQVTEAVLLNLHQLVSANGKITEPLEAAKRSWEYCQFIAIYVHFQQLAQKADSLR